MDRVRLATPADAPRLRALWAQFGTEVADEAGVRAVLAHPGTSVIVAPADAPAAALVLHLLPNATWSGRPYGLIENVLVDAARRGEGLGRAIVGAALERARAAGAYKVMLLSGRGRGARGFYEACGFEAQGKWGMQVRM